MSQKERIVEQSLQMFVTQGIKSVRMDDIAHRLGISKRTLYELFGNKEQLLYLCLVHLHEKQHDEVVTYSAQGRNVLERMILTGVKMIAYLEPNRRIKDDMLRFYPSVFERVKLRYMHEDGLKEVKDRLQQCIEEGYIQSDIDINLSLTILYYTVSGLNTGGKLPEGVTLQHAYGYMLVNFLRGMSTPKGMQTIDDLVERLTVGAVSLKN